MEKSRKAIESAFEGICVYFEVIVGVGSSGKRIARSTVFRQVLMVLNVNVSRFNESETTLTSEYSFSLGYCSVPYHMLVNVFIRERSGKDGHHE